MQLEFYFIITAASRDQVLSYLIWLVIYTDSFITDRWLLRIKRKVASRQTNPTFTVSISVRNEFIH
jgi:hypothetical protein